MLPSNLIINHLYKKEKNSKFGITYITNFTSTTEVMYMKGSQRLACENWSLVLAEQCISINWKVEVQIQIFIKVLLGFSGPRGQKQCILIKETQTFASFSNF